MSDSLLTNFVDAAIRSSEKKINGRTTTRPALFVGDESGGEMYVVNVDVGDEEILLDVAVAAGNNELRYASAGSPVSLEKVAGQWTVTGFSKTMPGTYHRIPVTVPQFEFGLPDYSRGEVEDKSFIVRALTYAELSELGTYGSGSMPYGALGKFRGAELLEVFI